MVLHLAGQSAAQMASPKVDSADYLAALLTQDWVEPSVVQMAYLAVPSAVHSAFRWADQLVVRLVALMAVHWAAHWVHHLVGHWAGK